MKKPLELIWKDHIPEVGSKPGFIIKSLPSIMINSFFIVKGYRLSKAINFGMYAPYIDNNVIWVDKTTPYLYDGTNGADLYLQKDWVLDVVRQYNETYSLFNNFCQKCHSGIVLCKECMKNVKKEMEF